MKRIIFGQTLVEKYKHSKKLKNLYISSDVLVQGNNTVKVIKGNDKTLCFIKGSITGRRKNSDLLDSFDIINNNFKNILSSLAIEKCKKELEGRYILARVDKEGRFELSPDRYGMMDMYYQKIDDGYIFSTELSLLPFKDNEIKYDQFGLAHALYVYGFRPPKRHTIYNSVKRLGVGEFAVWENGRLTFREIPPYIVDSNDEYGDVHLNQYADIWLDALEKRSSSSGNLVYVSSGWDSTSLLAGLVYLHGPEKVTAVIGRFHFAERSGFSNPFELKRVKAVCDYFGVNLEIAEIDHAYRGPEIVDRWQEFQRNHMFSGLSIYLWALLSEFVIKEHGDKTVFSGEISDGVHNFGFSQHTTIHGHPSLEFREYSDKMASYLFGPSFLSSILNGTTEDDVIHDLLKRQHSGGIFDKMPSNKVDCISELFAGMFTRDVRMPFWSLRNSKIFTDYGRELYKTEMETEYFKKPAEMATSNSLYSWYIHLYNSFHWQGGTVTTLAYTAEKQGFEMCLPFYDSRIHEFLAAMPESWGRGLEIRPTKYPLKWILKNRIDYPMHLQVGPHSYLYDIDPNFNFAGEFIYASAYTPLIKERLKQRKYEALLSPEVFDIDYYNKIVDNYLAGKEVVPERNDLSALAFLTLTGWF